MCPVPTNGILRRFYHFLDIIMDTIYKEWRRIEKIGERCRVPVGTWWPCAPWRVPVRDGGRAVVAGRVPVKGVAHGAASAPAADRQ